MADKKNNNNVKDFNEIKKNNEVSNNNDSDDIKINKNKKISQNELLENEIIKLKEENQSLVGDIKKIAAEFDNYQKRIKNEIQNIRKYANQDIILELSNILNTFDLALKSAKDDNPLKEGVIMIKTMFLNILENNKVKFLNPINEIFDYKYHEAMFTEKTNNIKDDNKVVEVYEQGIVLEERIIKPAKVKILIYEKSNNECSDKNEEI